MLSRRPFKCLVMHWCITGIGNVSKGSAAFITELCNLISMIYIVTLILLAAFSGT